jgi:hypothetical protein
MTVLMTEPEHALYASWEIQAFRSVQRFSDYRKIKGRLRRTIDNGANLAKDRRPSWRFLLSDRWLTIIIAVGTIVLVLIGVATLIVMLR